MVRPRLVLLLVGALALAGCGGGSQHRRARTVAPASLEHQVGAYAVHATDVRLFRSLGFSLDLTKRIENPAPDGVRYIDARPSGLISGAVHGRHCKLSIEPCVIPSDVRSRVLERIRAIIEQDHTNPGVAAIYVQDDYSGNVLSLLEQVHQMAGGLPTVCGFGATLDFTHGGHTERDQASLAHYANVELHNYSPAACDNVQLYVYSLGHHSPGSDYTMAGLLPALLNPLKQAGWNGQGLIGAPQAWEGVPNTGDQLEQQTRAFCRAGATAIVAFTWHNFSDGEPELANSADLRSGLAAGARDCQQIWTGPPLAQLAPTAPGLAVMFDTVTPSAVPSSPFALAGYTSGRWPNYLAFRARFPGVHVVSIAINVGHHAACLDAEPGDATPGQVVAWIRADRASGFRQPCVYSSVWEFTHEIRPLLAAAGIPRASIYEWSANFTFVPHLDPGFDATQWTDRAFGRNLDESFVTRSFLSIAQPPLKPAPPPDPLAFLPLQRFHIGRTVASERLTVRTWRRARCQAPARRRMCVTSRDHARLLAGRDLFVATHARRRGRWHRLERPRWGYPAGEPLGPRFHVLSAIGGAR